MITKIQNSFFAKPLAIAIAFSLLFMSFTIKGDESVILKSGTAIYMETINEIDSKTINVGQTIDFKINKDVIVDNKVVIASGSIAKGQVIRAQKAKGLGKQGFVEIQIKTVTAVDGQDVFLTGNNLYQEGESQESLAIVLGVLLCILFLTLKGKNTVIPQGQQVSTAVATNTTINIKN